MIGSSADQYPLSLKVSTQSVKPFRLNLANDIRTYKVVLKHYLCYPPSG